MLKSMYSGISGMKANQTKLDVIGNNISNVNTTSFKSSRASFSDLLSQSTSSAQAASTTQGGTNAKQVGLGVQLASIDKIMTQGSMQATNRALDVAIDGTGYFMVSTGPSISGDGTLEVSHKTGTHSISNQSLQTSGAQISYTRDGAFIRDNEGNLLTSSGYRVLGYSLTNDDSTIGATSVSPNNVTINDTLNFTFGPGSQLNGYKVQLGTIGEGTTTGATISTTNKTITISGDFSVGSSLTPDAINTALSSELTKAGISQTITASGKISPISAANKSDSISGGVDAGAPGTVTCAGFTFSFGEGTELNDKYIQLGSVSAETTTAKLDGNIITINGDFVNGNVTKEQLTEAINNELNIQGITQEVKVTGSNKNFTGLSATAGTAAVAKAPVLSSSKTDVKAIDSNNIAGFTIEIDNDLCGNDLNSYQIVFTKSTGDPTVVADSSKQTITISGDLEKLGTEESFSFDKFNTLIGQELKSKGINDASFKIQSGAYDSASSTKDAYFLNGVDDSSAGTVTVAGYTIETPKASVLEALSKTHSEITSELFNGMKFVIGDVNQTSPPVSAEYDGKGTVTISGNFTSSSSGLTKSDIENAINEAFKDKFTGLTQDLVSVSGNSNTVYQSTKSEAISGGTVLQNANSVTIMDSIELQPISGGAALNGYTIQMGTVTAGTKLGATVNTTSKVITVNGDFTKNGYTAKDICDAINKEIANSTLGSGVAFKAKDDNKKTSTVGSAESENITGGTSVQSLSGDGSVYYVDASSDVKAYDGSLKTLKIPEKVKIAGTDTELSVTDYSISSDGTIIGTLSNGTMAALGQIAMASFANPEGLTSTGNNLFSESVNSGSPVIKSGLGTHGEDNSKGFGNNIQGYLEMSNVDLAEQFTDMIVTTKAFQGASKMITTGDEILSEIINLKR